MQRRVVGIVERITMEREGVQEILVRVQSPVENDNDDATVLPLRPALNLIDFSAPVAIGERVLLNTIAVELGLGTGGFDFVVASLDSAAYASPAAGHIMKLRYTPLQTPVLAVEAPESPHHHALVEFEGLSECPVVCAELHSQVPAICSAVRWGLREAGWGRDPRIVYVMTDGASLPLALSRLVPEMKARQSIQATITAGQAFGGDYEAVNIYSALAAARVVCEADVIVVAQGPGNVGTGTSLGFSGIEQGIAINAAGSLGGIPILAPRISFSDARHRHMAVSHHTRTVLQHVVLVPSLIAVPALPREERRAIRDALGHVAPEEIHQTIVVSSDQAFDEFKRIYPHVTTMGRTVEEESAFFLAATAAGLLAAQVIEAGVR